MPSNTETKNHRKPMSITLPPELHDRIAQEADARMVDKSLLAEKAFEQYLPTLPPIPGTEEAAEPELALDTSEK